MLPHARADGLLVHELADEVLVYDLDRHKARCLNRTAALVWRHCDGGTSVPELTRLVEREWGAPVDEAVVWLALDQLGKARLLRERVSPPAGAARLSRREAMRRLALAGGLAALLPAVLSVVAPTAAEAASCITPQECTSRLPPNCGGDRVCLSPVKYCLKHPFQDACVPLFP